MKKDEQTARGEQKVKAANRRFYDLVAGEYESIDGRRSAALESWLRRSLSGLRRDAPGGALLDLGAGSGLVTRCATGIFEQRFASDLSPAILIGHRGNFSAGIAADVDHLPFLDDSFDVVTCFAALHHLYDFEALVPEVKRVLRPGGIFYSDHDMDLRFYRNFKLPLMAYRKMRNNKARYQQACGGICAELYDLSEWHEKGVDAERLLKFFQRTGFAVSMRYHWYGLSTLTDRLFGWSSFRRGLAPLLAIRAVKLLQQ